MFPAKYREGAFIAFHGSWDRSPLPQAGYNLTFQPLRNGKASAPYEVFASTFAPHLNVQGATDTHRPVGIAQGPDGAIYVTDDNLGRIYKIQYTGK
jgi:glucose/arabinose dehydrogenase